MTTRTFLITVALSALDRAIIFWLVQVARRPVEICSEWRAVRVAGVEITAASTPRGSLREHLVALAVVILLASLVFLLGVYHGSTP